MVLAALPMPCAGNRIIMVTLLVMAAEDNAGLHYNWLQGCMDDDDDGDDVGFGKERLGRGAPGRPRKRKKFYPHPDASNVARDIIRTQEAHEDDDDFAQKHKDWRFTYRVPFSVFKVRIVPLTCSLWRCVCTCVRSTPPHAHSAVLYARLYARPYARPYTLVCTLVCMLICALVCTRVCTLVCTPVCTRVFYARLYARLYARP